MPKNLQSLLSSFKIDDQFEPVKMSAESGGTGGAKAYFAQADPFEGLPLILSASVAIKPEGNPFAQL